MALMRMKVSGAGRRVAWAPGDVIEAPEAVVKAWCDGIRAERAGKDDEATVVWPSPEGEDTAAEPTSEVPEKAKPAIEWVGDDKERAVEAARVELALDEDDRRVSVLKHVAGVLEVEVDQLAGAVAADGSS